MDTKNIKNMDKKIDDMMSAKEFENTDLTRLIVLIEQKMVGGDLEVTCGETVTYTDLLFSILCLFDSLAKDNKNVGTVEKIFEDLQSMYKVDEFHKEEV